MYFWQQNSYLINQIHSSLKLLHGKIMNEANIVLSIMLYSEGFVLRLTLNFSLNMESS
jgi:hypothetical protein